MIGVALFFMQIKIGENERIEIDGKSMPLRLFATDFARKTLKEFNERLAEYNNDVEKVSSDLTTQMMISCLILLLLDTNIPQRI